MDAYIAVYAMANHGYTNQSVGRVVFCYHWTILLTSIMIEIDTTVVTPVAWKSYNAPRQSRAKFTKIMIEYVTIPIPQITD